MSDNTRKANAAPRCQFIRLNDQPCTQPALKEKMFCRFHDLVEGPPLPAALIPFVEDATSLQLALMQVIRGLQFGQIDRHLGGTILYALQIAASNLKRFSEEAGHPFAEPGRNSANPAKHHDEDEELEGPSFAEILLERLQLLGSELKEQSETRQVSTRPTDAPLPSVAKPESDVIDKLEACDEPSRRNRWRPTTGDWRTATDDWRLMTTTGYCS